MLIGCACVGTVLGGMYLHGDLSGGEIYNVPLHDAYLRAQNVAVPSGFGAGLMSEGSCDIERTPDDSVAWSCSRDGKTVGRVIATFREASQGRTRVWISFKAAEASGESAERGQGYLKTVGKPVMGEKIAAAIEERPVNAAVLQGAMQGYVMTHMGDLQKDIGETFANVSTQMKQDSHSESYDRAQAAAGQPTVDLDHRGSSSRYR